MSARYLHPRALVVFLLAAVSSGPHTRCRAERDADLQGEEASGNDLDTAAPKTADPMPLPRKLRRRFAHASFLKAGSFGEAWRAEDVENGGRPVALKMFFAKDPENESVHVPLTWRLITDTGDHRIKNRLKYAAKECRLAQDMQQYNENDPSAASRIMRCYEDHTVGSVHDSKPLYQVFEYCGSTSLTKWIQDSKELASSNPKGYVLKSLDIFNQLMHVLQYFSSFDSQWVHHDLKPENIMVNKGTDGRDYIKIIDLGSASLSTPENARLSAVSSPAYAEPTWFDKVGNMLLDGESWLRGYSSSNPSSYDVYAAGAILDELITGVSTYEKLQHAAGTDAATQVPGYVPEMCRRQRLYGRLATRAKHDGNLVTLSDALKDLESTRSRDDQLCAKWIRILRVKGEAGSERRLTAHWGQGDDWAQSAINHEEDVDWLMDSRKETKTGFDRAVAQYRSLTKPSGWYGTFMRMLALDPLKRPLPSEVLQHGVMAAVGEVLPLRPAPDVPFDAADTSVMLQEVFRQDLARERLALEDAAVAERIFTALRARLGAGSSGSEMGVENERRAEAVSVGLARPPPPPDTLPVEVVPAIVAPHAPVNF